ncbi:MAG: type II toxin-antitoxin system VapC family toxin [Clostridia bacterium]|nr:type II toxin-antitoxin system VapC family toxin [Clostridia bacterium]
MKYMLDTNIIAYARNNRPEVVLEKFREHDLFDMCISAITLAELEYGIANSSRPLQNRLGLMAFLTGIEVLDFDAEAAMEYGLIRTQLKRQGAPIGANDLLIAAHAKSRGLTLITNNTKEFERIEGLSIENWT